MLSTHNCQFSFASMFYGNENVNMTYLLLDKQNGNSPQFVNTLPSPSTSEELWQLSGAYCFNCFFPGWKKLSCLLHLMRGILSWTFLIEPICSKFGFCKEETVWVKVKEEKYCFWRSKKVIPRNVSVINSGKISIEFYQFICLDQVR